MKEISDLVIVMGTTVSESEKEERNRKAGLHFRHLWWLGEFLLICFFLFFFLPSLLLYVLRELSCRPVGGYPPS